MAAAAVAAVAAAAVSQRQWRRRRRRRQRAHVCGQRRRKRSSSRALGRPRHDSPLPQQAARARPNARRRRLSVCVCFFLSHSIRAAACRCCSHRARSLTLSLARSLAHQMRRLHSHRALAPLPNWVCFSCRRRASGCSLRTNAVARCASFRTHTSIFALINTPSPPFAVSSPTFARSAARYRTSKISLVVGNIELKPTKLSNAMIEQKIAAANVFMHCKRWRSIDEQQQQRQRRQ